MAQDLAKIRSEVIADQPTTSETWPRRSGTSACRLTLATRSGGRQGQHPRPGLPPPVRSP